MRRLIALLLALALVAAACSGDSEETTTTTAAPATTTTTTRAPTTTTTQPDVLDPEGFYLMLMWHQHQPLYPLDENGNVTRPWVRVHATKDYYDHAAIIEQYPGVVATINLTPVLLLQLEALANGTKDVYWVLSEIPAADLTDEDKAYIEARFFDTNPGIVARFPRYQELADKRSAGDAYTTQDYLDLQILFNLAWTDPDFLATEPLASLVAKGRDFAEEDKEVLFAKHLEIIEAVIPLHARLWDEGVIEVTTTPLAHPILPLISDTSLAAAGDPAALLPDNRFQEIPDATEHVRRGLAEAERLLGRTPNGMWPGEGSVAQLVMSLFSREGVQWVATGEDVLARSLDMTFTRDSNDVVEQVELYKPWNAQLTRNPDIAMFFRDVRLADLLGFEYSGMSGAAAADDFMRRLRNVKEVIDASGDPGPHVISVILDGENAWEYYENDGKDFLNALYANLQEADFVRTVTPTQYLEAFGDQTQGLDEVFPAAWFQPNFATWIGEPEEADAWDYLYRARQDYRDAEQSGEVAEDALAAAFEKMLFAEGSDWFWWYGSDQESGNDDYFDAAYRELLGQMYDALGQERPLYVSVPIIPETVLNPTASPEDLVTITVDNTIDDAEWATAGRYEALGGDLLDAVYYGFDVDNLYVRVDFAREVLGDADAAFDLYLGIPSAGADRGATLAGTVLGFGATHVVQWRGTDPVTVTEPMTLPALGREDRFSEIGELLDAGFDGDRIEFALPLERLGTLEVGDLVPFRLVDRTGAVDDGLFPAAGLAAASVPDISNVEPLLAVTDPVGDDHGPGTYTYPTDGVFAAGSYDLEAFSVGQSGEELVFTFDVVAPIQNSWNSPRGFSIQTFDLYIDQDPGAGTGIRTMIGGRNAALGPDDGWEYGITVEGWYPAIYVANPDGTAERTEPTFTVITVGDKGRVIARVPASLLGEGDPAAWGYAVVVMSQEGYPSSGVVRVRDVEEAAGQWRVGGGTGSINDSRILDVLYPDPGVQEQLLSDYTGVATGSIDDLGPDDFGTVPLVTN
jgi:alpha-amylase/alpha-mannosidase (GH57 family)